MKTIINESGIADAVDSCLFDSGPNIYVENPKEAKMQVWIRIYNKAYLSNIEIQRVSKVICKKGCAISVCAAMRPVMPCGHEPYIAIVALVDELKDEYRL